MAGLVIDLDTKIEVVDKFLPLLDMVLIMSVKAGKGGQEFDKSAIKKIKYVRNKDAKILIYCRSGNRSVQATEKLVKLGYTNLIEIGGIIDYTGEISSNN